MGKVDGEMGIAMAWHGFDCLFEIPLIYANSGISCIDYVWEKSCELNACFRCYLHYEHVERIGVGISRLEHMYVEMYPGANIRSMEHVPLTLAEMIDKIKLPNAKQSL